MLPRRRCHPDNHWRVGFDVNMSHGLGCGPFVFVGGQVDLDPAAADAEPRRPVGAGRPAPSSTSRRCWPKPAPMPAIWSS